MSEQQKEPVIRTVCMDCSVVIHAGDTEVPVSHGLCEHCFKIRMAEVQALLKPQQEGAA
jgi:hypothetical protein